MVSISGRGTKSLIFLAGLMSLALVLGAVLLGLGSAGGQTAVTTTVSTTVSTVPTTGTEAASNAEASETESELGTFAEPYQIGDRVLFSYEDFSSGSQTQWQIEVLSPVEDWSQQHLEENEFNDPPAAGEVFATTRLRATYLSGPSPGQLSEIDFGAVGPSGRALSTYDNICGVSPDEFDTLAKLRPGQSVEGNICWAAPLGDVADLKLILGSAFADYQVIVQLR